MTKALSEENTEGETEHTLVIYTHHVPALHVQQNIIDVRHQKVPRTSDAGGR